MSELFKPKTTARDVTYKGQIKGMDVENVQEALDGLTFNSELAFGKIYVPEGEPLIADHRSDAISFESYGDTLSIKSKIDDEGRKKIIFESKSLAMLSAQIAAGYITGFNEQVDDRVGELLVAGTGITISYDDAAGTITISSTATGSALIVQNNDSTIDSAADTLDFSSQFTVTSSPAGEANISITSILASVVSDFSEAVDDRVSSLIQNGTGITWSYNDGAGTLTPTVTITQYTDEMAQDTVATLIQNGTGITWSYNDGANTLTPTVSLSAFSTTDLAEGSNLYYTDERVDDRVAVLIQNGTGISWSYSDAGGTLTPTVTLAPFTTTNLAEGSNLYFTNGRAQSAAGWQDDGTVVRLVGTTDEVVIGGTAALSSAKVSIDGDTDQIQFIVQGNATQTTDLVVFETSAGTDLFNFSNAGVGTVTGQWNVDNLRLDGNTLSATTGGINFQAVTSSSFTFQSSAADNDLTFAFTGTTNSGQFKWMEDEDYFQFDDEIRVLRSDTATDTQFTLAQSSTGDATQAWLLTGGQQYNAYIDNSDTDSWKVEDITNADVFIDYDPTGTGTLNLGTAGDISFGDSTLRNATPQSDGKIQLGSASLGWAGILCSGNAAVTIGLNRHTTSNTAGNDLTVNAGGATSGATDKAGGLLILSPGQTTGTGRDTVKIKGYFPAVSTGTGNNTQVDREIIGGFIAVANNTTTTVVSCTLANGSVVGGVLRYCVEVTNGTDYQVEQGSVSYIVTNKAGAVANNTTVKFGNQQATTSGTLTVTWTITAANPALIQVNANSSLTPSTGFPKVTFNLSQLTQQAITLS